MISSMGPTTCVDETRNAPVDDGAATRSVAEGARPAVAFGARTEIGKTVSTSARRRNADTVIAHGETNGCGPHDHRQSNP